MCPLISLASKVDKRNIAFPLGMVTEVQRIINIENSWLSFQEFVRDAVKEKIDRWKREHPPKV